jgi:hypothetical protein
MDIDQMATGFISITEFGAKGDGRTDNTAAIQRAFDSAKATGKSVFIPEGVFNHSGVLRANGISIDGAGAKSVLHATTAAKSALIVTGDGVKVTDLSLTSVSGTRISSYDASGLVLSGTKNFLVQNVIVKAPCGAGIIMHGASYGTVKGSTVMDTGADSIHMVAQSHHLTITGNNVLRSGDDGISVVSYQKHGGPVSDILVTGNTVQNNDWARGLTVVGGQNVQIVGNFVKSTADHAGIYIAQEASYQTYGVSNVLIKGNRLVDTGGTSTGHGAIMVYNSGEADIRSVTVTGNIVEDSRKTGVLVNGSRIDGVKVSDNGFDGGKVAAVFVMNGAKNVSFTGNAWSDFPKLIDNLNAPVSSIALSGNYVGLKPPLPPVGSVVVAPTPTPTPTPDPAPALPPATSKLDAIELKLAASSFKGDPKFQLQVDGKDVGGVQTVTVQKGAGWQTFKFMADIADGGGKVSIKFLNDYYVAGQGDRNLWFDKLLVNGKIVADTDMMMGRTGTYDFAVPAALAKPAGTATALASASTFAAQPAPASVDTIVVKAASQSWNGDAQFRLLADGKQIGAVQTVTTDAGQGWQAFTFKADLADATKTLGIEFLNDAYGGVGKDRNLHVDAIIVNGVTEHLANPVLGRSGVSTIDVTEHAFDGVMHDASHA